VNDLAALKRFWVETLGFTEEPGVKTWLYIRRGAGALGNCPDAMPWSRAQDHASLA